MIGLIGTLIEHSFTVADLTSATKEQEILGLTISFAVVTGGSLQLLPAFLTDKIIGFPGCIHGFSFHRLTCAPIVDPCHPFYCGTRITEYMP